ncbi:MAG: hypothetical protein NW215_04515 [Hyphomicrobiales bacterium]|nr:hypothetical protein [Hyphomicrobiales bacterium]
MRSFRRRFAQAGAAKAAAAFALLCLAGCGGGASLSVGLSDGDAAPSLAASIPPPPLPAPRDPSRGKNLAALAAAAPKPQPQPPKSGLFGALALSLPAEALKPGVHAPSSVQTEMTPVTAYAAVARFVQKCWLSYAKPRLANHKFDGEASLDGGGSAKILIYETAPDQQLGRAAFRVDFSSSAGGALIESANIRLSEQDREKLQADIARWARGEETCS